MRKNMFSHDGQMGSNRWSVIRLRAGNKTEVINLSPAFFAMTTHWVGHTVPCCIDDCDLCELVPARGLFYLAVFCMNRTMLLELGAQSSGHLEQHAELLHGGLRPGLIINCSRRGQKQPVYSEITGSQENVSAVSKLALAAKVMALYKLPCPNPTEDLDRYSERLVGMVRGRNVRLSLEMRAGKTPGMKGR
jgi:hypothetical protein